MANMFLNGARHFLHLVWNRDYYVRYNEILRINHEFMCEMQGQFIAFSFLSNDKHRELKNAIKTKKSPAEIQKLFNEFETITDDGIEKAINCVWKFMGDHFSRRVAKSRFHTPRFCIKIERNGKIIAIYDGIGQTNEGDSTIEQDTGLKQVIETKKPYLQNNIPHAVKNGNYENARLNSGAARRYKRNDWGIVRFLKMTFLKTPTPEDIDWMACWNSPPQQLPPTNKCYKSTLIVPISLRNNMMPNAFLQKLGKAARNGDQKLNYGFLCADCHDSNFFEEDDKKMCYIFADCISLFLISYMYLRDHSELYKEAKLICTAFAEENERNSKPSADIKQA